MKKLIAMIMAVMLLTTGIMTGCKSKNDVIKIGHKNYTEQRLVGQILSLIIEEKTDFKTEVIEFGGTMLCFDALKRDEIEMYAEYTGTAYGAILKETEILGPEETYDFVKREFEDQFNMTWLDEIGYNNTYILSVTQETANELGLEKISDIIPHAGDMIIGSDNEFLGRVDGMPGFKETYGIEFKNELPMDQGLTYAAVNDGEIDVNVSFSTDGRIEKFNLVNLEDDKGYFPPYYVATILKQEFKEGNEEVINALNLLTGIFTEEDMQKYNLLVDEGTDARKVAKTALMDKGIMN